MGTRRRRRVYGHLLRPVLCVRSSRANSLDCDPGGARLKPPRIIAARGIISGVTDKTRWLRLLHDSEIALRQGRSCWRTVAIGDKGEAFPAREIANRFGGALESLLGPR